jgi:hypothetical protein
MSEFHSLEHAELASKAIDPYRLMDGEHSESKEPEDFQHWIRIYSELATFKERMLADMRQHLPDMPAVAAAEIRGIDMAVIRRQLARYEARLTFWKERVAEVAGARQKSSRNDVAANPYP